MSHSYFNLQLNIALEVALDHLKRIESVVVASSGPTLGSDICEQVWLLFKHLCDYHAYLLAKTGSGQKIDCSLPDLKDFKNINVEIFGVYKYFTNLCQKMESNYCKITMNGILVNGGNHSSKTLYLSNLMDSDIFFLPEPLEGNEAEPEVEPEVDADGCYVDRDEILKALIELKNHYSSVLKFL